MNDMTTVFIRTMPRDLKDRFKSWCSLRGDSMTDVVVKLMSDIGNDRVTPPYIHRRLLKKPSPRTTELFIRNVPVGIKAQFKKKCEELEEKMKHVLLAGIRRLVEEPK